jgi:diaminopimelate decarboxylase
MATVTNADPAAQIRETPAIACFGGIALTDVAAQFGTPTYVYDLDAMAASAASLTCAFGSHPHLIAYAMKANSAAPVLATFRDGGCGADVVSGGELALALRVGFAPRKIVMSGVAKSDDELDFAIQHQIGAIQVESREELARIVGRARTAKQRPRVSLRVNPGVEELNTHKYIRTGHDEAKFGIATGDAKGCLQEFPNELELVGLTVHVGSQFTDTAGYLRAADVLFGLAAALRARFALEFVDTGGGFGIDYGEGCDASPADFVRETLARQRQHGLADLALHVEPGRALVGAHGLLLTRLIQQKHSSERSWWMVDAGMNDLLRPALYQARHRIGPVVNPSALFAVRAEETLTARPTTRLVRVVGPVCESSDDFGEYLLPEEPPSELLAIHDVGAYGYSMASTYNGRALPAEVFVRAGQVVAAKPRNPREAWVCDRLATSDSPNSGLDDRLSLRKP